MKIFRYIVLASVLSVVLSCIKERTSGADLAVGDKLPDFSVTMNDGAVLTGDSLREGISFVVFFHTPCSDCKKVLPEIQKIYDEYAPCGVRFALISREETAQTIGEFWDSEGLTMPYSAQEGRKIYELFAKTGVPRVYICKEGIIEAMSADNPLPDYDDFKAALEALGTFNSPLIW